MNHDDNFITQYSYSESDSISTLLHRTHRLERYYAGSLTKYRFEYKVGERVRVIVVGYNYRFGLELYSASHGLFKLVANDFMGIER